MSSCSKCHAEITRGEPLREAGPSAGELPALKFRVVDQGGEPSRTQNSRFSLPTARDDSELCECVSGPPQGDGTFKAVLVPGPPKFELWSACWRVFRAALFCSRYPAGRPGEVSSVQRRIVSMAALEEYFETFKALCARFSDWWHLCVSGKD